MPVLPESALDALETRAMDALRALPDPGRVSVPWESLRQFARNFAADPEHARYMELLAQHHVDVMSSLSAEARKTVEPFLE